MVTWDNDFDIILLIIRLLGIERENFLLIARLNPIAFAFCSIVKQREIAQYLAIVKY